MTMLERLQDILYIAKKIILPSFSCTFKLDPQHVLDHKSDSLNRNITSNDEKNIITLRYVIPEQACIDGRLTLSGYIAIFDEVTTWAFSALDRCYRPGLSTSLSAEFHGRDDDANMKKAGDVVLIDARVMKMGNTFGFAEGYAMDETTGRILCSCRHTKYLPIGFWFELVLGPWLFPLTKILARWLRPPITKEPPTSIEKLLAFEKVSSDHKVGTLQVTRQHCSPMGSCHGGCLAMGMEYMGVGYAKEKKDGAKKGLLFRRLKSMNITYMTTGKNAIEFDSNWIDVGDTVAPMSVRVVRSESKKLVAEGILHFVEEEKNKEE